MHNVPDTAERVYGWLSALFRHGPEPAARVPAGSPLLQAAISRVAPELLEELVLSEAALTEVRMAALRAGHQRFFIGPDTLPAPPWGSVYQTSDRLLFGPGELEVRRFYEAFGLSVTNREPADGLAFELAFAARLCTPAGDEVETVHITAERHRFLEVHMMPWVSQWAEALLASEADPYWAAAAQLTVRAVLWDLNDHGAAD